MDGIQMEKYLLLEANRENGGLISEGDWSSMSWKVYSDRTYCLQIGFIPEQNPSDYIQKSGTMRRDFFAKLCLAMNQDWSSELISDGCDGEAWELKQYSPDGIIIRSSGELGYIYGQEALERIVKCLPGKTFAREHTIKAERAEQSEGMFYKENETDKVWWYEKYGVIGEMLFSFNKKKLYNLFRDYPHKLTVDEWMTFNKENEYWANFFADRNEKYEAEHIEEIEKRRLSEAH